jgi:hypothetical protein
VAPGELGPGRRRSWTQAQLPGWTQRRGCQARHSAAAARLDTAPRLDSSLSQRSLAHVEIVEGRPFTGAAAGLSQRSDMWAGLVLVGAGGFGGGGGRGTR